MYWYDGSKIDSLQAVAWKKQNVCSILPFGLGRQNNEASTHFIQIRRKHFFLPK